MLTARVDTTEVIIAPSGGWIIREPDAKGRPLYVGSDSYWSRLISVPVAYKVEADAQRECNRLIEDKRRYRG